jgi:hypothetical protein
MTKTICSCIIVDINLKIFPLRFTIMSFAGIELVYRSGAAAQAELAKMAWTRAEERIATWTRSVMASVRWTEDEEKGIVDSLRIEVKSERNRQRKLKDRAEYCDESCCYTSPCCRIMSFIMILGSAIFSLTMGLVYIEPGEWDIIPFIILALSFYWELFFFRTLGDGCFNDCGDRFKPWAIRSVAILAVALSVASWYCVMKVGFMRHPSLTISLFVFAIFSQIQFILDMVSVCWRRYWTLLANRARESAQVVEKRISAGEETAYVTRTAAKDAFAAVESALTITKTWFTTLSKAITRSGNRSKVSSELLFNKLTDAIHAWSAANAMCKSIVKIQDARDIAELAIQVWATVSMAKSLSMEAEKISYPLDRPAAIYIE